jgi:DNA polymerase I-like protein with 3'-5' exonuclease and polymerase domains
MLKYGELRTQTDKYSVFILETKETRRLDIVSEGEKFNQLDTNLLYGEYTKRGKFYTYGDKRLGKLFNNTISFAKSIDVKTNLENKWDNGKFIVSQIKDDAASKSYYKLVTINNVFSEELSTYDGVQVALFKYEKDLDFDLPPLTLNQYSSSKLTKMALESSTLPYYSMDVLRSRYDLSWMDHKDYKVIDNIDEAREYLDLLRKEKPALLGYDYETTTLDFVRGNEDAKIVGLVLSHKKDFSRYFPFLHNAFDNLPYEFMNEIVDCIKEIGAKTIAHNSKYENTVNIHCNIPLRMDYCTQTLSQLLNSERTRGTHALKTLEFKMTGEHYLELDEIFTDKSKIDFKVLPKEIVRYYACPDADGTLQLFLKMYPQLTEPQIGLFEMESKLCYISAGKEWYGYRLNKEHFISEFDNVKAVQNYLEDLIHKLTRSEVKLTSSIQMQELLYKRLGRPIYSYTDKGQPSVGVKAIKRLARENRENPTNIVKSNIVDNNGNLICTAQELNTAKYPECRLLLKWKVYNKLVSGFYNRLFEGSRGDRYFSWIQQNGTASGRESSPMHQLPGPVKYDILPDSDDHVFVDTDYSCMELRAMAWLAHQEDLIEAEKDINYDIHRGCKSIIDGTPQWAVSKEDRGFQKRVNFGIPYLITKYGLAEQLYGASPTKEQIAQADAGQKAFMFRFRNIAQFLHDNRNRVLKDGYMSTYFGRVRHFEKIFNPGIANKDKEALIRQANNLPVQGTCADIMKNAQVHVQEWIERKGWDKLVDTPQGKFPLVRIALTIHDEILLCVHKSVPLVEVYIMLQDCMEVEIEGAPPFYAIPAVVANLGDAKADKYGLPPDLRNQMIREYNEEGKWHEAFADPVADQLKLNDEFREKEIIDYMEGLIKEYNSTDPKVISEHVRHDTLTHDLIARFPQSKEHKKVHGKLSHIDSIAYATEEYMKFRQGLDLNTDTEEESLSYTELSEEDIDNLCELVINTDDEGNELISEEDKQDILKVNMSDNDAQEINHLTNYEMPLVWSLFNMLLLDISKVDPACLDDLLHLVDLHHRDNAYIRIMFYKNGDIIDTQRRVDKIDEEQLTDWIKEHTVSYNGGENIG